MKDENEKTKTDYKALLRELAVRGRYVIPEDEKEKKWFDDGTDLKKCPDFLKRILDATK